MNRAEINEIFFIFVVGTVFLTQIFGLKKKAFTSIGK